MSSRPRIATDLGPARVYAPRMYRIDPDRSRITFTVRFLGVAKVRGVLPGVSGTIVLSPEPGERSLRVRVSAEGIRTGLDLRDRHLRSRNYFDVKRHPEIAFQATRIDQVGEQVRIVGTLVVRGIAREIDVAATVVSGGSGDRPRRARAIVDGVSNPPRARYETRFVIDRRAFSIGTGGGLRSLSLHPANILIGREAEVHVVLEGEAVG